MSSGNDKFEREFEAFLSEEDSRLAALYRKLPQPEPDARLDAAVHAMAHRALNPQLVATPRVDTAHRRRLRWLPALGAAAGVVFAAGIAWRLSPSLHGDRDENGAPASDVVSVRQLDVPAAPVEPPLSPAPPPGSAPTDSGSAANAPAKKQATTGGTTGESARVEQEEAARLDTTPGAASTVAGSLGKVEKPAPPSAQPKAFPVQAAPARKRAPELDAVERRQAMAEGAWQALHEHAASDRQGAAKQAAPPADEKTRTATASPEVARRPPASPSEFAGPASEKQATAAAAEPAPRYAPAAAASPPSAAPASAATTTLAAPAAAGVAKESTSAPQAEMARKLSAPPPAREEPVATSKDTTVLRDSAAAAPAAFPPGQAQSTTDRAKADAASNELKQKSPAAVSKDPNAMLYPEHWLANIRVMLRENRRDDALRSLAEFRKMYPAYHLPDDLRDLR